MKHLQLTSQKNHVSAKVEKLIQEGIFTEEQKSAVLSAIFNQELPFETHIELNNIQSKWIVFLSFNYTASVRGNKKTGLFKLITSSNNIGRHLKSLAISF